MTPYTPHLVTLLMRLPFLERSASVVWRRVAETSRSANIGDWNPGEKKVARLVLLGRLPGVSCAGGRRRREEGRCSVASQDELNCVDPAMDQDEEKNYACEDVAAMVLRMPLTDS